MLVTNKQIDISNFKICVNQNLISITDNVKYLGVHLAGHAMEWNGKWCGMEGEFWYGIWKMLRMEWKI